MSPSSDGALVKPCVVKYRLISASGCSTGGDASENLQQHRVAYSQRTVGLFGGEPIDLRVDAGSERFAADVGGLKTQHAFAVFEFPPGGKRGDDAMSEARERKGVGQKAEASTASHAGESEPVGQRGRGFVLP